MEKLVRQPLHYYWSPKYWPMWAGLGFLRVVFMLPLSWQFGIGRTIGRIAHRIGAERRAIARRNIKLCFPEMSADARNKLVHEHFEALGISLIELGLGRWASDDYLESITTIIGAEHIQHAIDAGYGVILLSAHFTTLELSGRVLALHCPPFDAVYRRFRSDFTTEIMVSNREVAARRVIEKNDIKSMVRSLREGVPVWYAPDQSYNLKQSALLPFFGVPSMTNTATGTLAKLGKAKAVPFFPRRLANGRYELTLLPAIADLPSGDAEEDTRQYTALLEQHIKSCPEQYYWVHRKFKNRPGLLANVYADFTSVK